MEFLHNPSVEVAPKLLGCELVREVNGSILRGRIVEVEAYDESDAASHSYKGRTSRTASMFGPAGFLYVYFTYGMHYCANIVVQPEGQGSAVLIRAVEPLEGIETMEILRHHAAEKELTNGPAKFCQAFAIDKTFDGHDLRQAPLRLIVKPPLSTEKITQTTRIGITKATDMPWRFYITDNPFVSHPAHT